MRKTVILLLAIYSLIGCVSLKNYYGKKGVKAKVISLVLMQDSWIHSIAEDSAYNRYQVYYQCLPDSVRVGRMVSVHNYQRLPNGSKVQWNVVPIPASKTSQGNKN